MTLEEIKKELKKPEYRFLIENEHLGNQIILLGLGGSHAYGTNTPTSDLDIRGIAIEKPNEIVGMSTFEQVLEKNTDTTVYAFRKICKLLADANPNIIEILGLKEDHYLYKSELGQKLLDNIDLFLSKKCYYTFRGYAKSNLDRLENALCRDRLPKEKEVAHIKRSLDNAIEDHNNKHKDKINLDNIKINENNELVVDFEMHDWPVDSLKDWYNSVMNTVNNYKQVLNRNHKKDDLHLNKHAMHLIRLYLMCIDVLEGKGVKTYREEDIPLLMSIRNGDYMEDGILSDKFYKMMNELEERCTKAFKESKLPDKPDFKKLEAFITEVSTEIINGKYQSNFVDWYNKLEE